MIQPLASIIIPLHNQNPLFLTECIESAINQTYRNTEIIISSNHITEKSNLNIIDNFCKKNTNIRVITPPVFLSMIDNFNYGFSASKGEWVTFLSSDDKLASTFIEDSLTAIKQYEQDVSFSYCFTGFYDERLKKIVRYARPTDQGYSSSKDSLYRFLTGKEGSFCGTLINRSAYIKCGQLDTKINYAGDIDIEIMLLKYGGAVFINKTLATVRLHERDEQNNRIVENLKDINYIYDKILKDQTLLSIIDGNTKYIKECKFNLYKPQIYQALKLASIKKIDNSLLKNFKLMVQQHYNSIPMRLCLSNINNIFGKIFFRLI